MGKQTGIEWTNATHNFWYGCNKVSAGCKFCYAERDMRRYGKDFGSVTRVKGFNKPFSWQEPMMVFVNSWSDFFIEDADPWRGRAWDIIQQTPHLTYQILTKRVERIPQCLPDNWGDGWLNVWLGVSVESHDYYHRIDGLMNTPAALRFISYEPALGPVSFAPWLASGKLHWIIAGGESCSNRPALMDWFRYLRNECKRHRVPFFFKQFGGNRKIDGVWGGNKLDGRIYHEFPIYGG